MHSFKVYQYSARRTISFVAGPGNVGGSAGIGSLLLVYLVLILWQLCSLVSPTFCMWLARHVATALNQLGA